MDWPGIPVPRGILAKFPTMGEELASPEMKKPTDSVLNPGKFGTVPKGATKKKNDQTRQLQHNAFFQHMKAKSPTTNLRRALGHPAVLKSRSSAGNSTLRKDKL